jgi:alpha-ketoglutarate-dependent taurine dioxygenase
MAPKISPLSAALGAEATGVDLRQPLDDASVKALRDAFDRNVVLVIRDQSLSEEDQLRAAGYFGKVAVRKKPAPSMNNPGGDYDTPFMLVTNIVENGKAIGAFGDGEMWFHHDTSYYPEPHRATFLYSVKLPSWGGNTCFSNMYKAYENIPRALRDRLEGRKVLQVHDYRRRERLDLDKIDLANVRHQEQPIFITHPATGRKALYISRLMSARIFGLSKEESEAALEHLFDISEDPAIVYEHEWRLGDLVIWDNWCSIHARKDFPREEPRLMRRLTIEGRAMRF